MSLDLDDVCDGQPQAKKELDALLAHLATVVSERDAYASALKQIVAESRIYTGTEHALREIAQDALSLKFPHQISISRDTTIADMSDDESRRAFGK